MNVLPRVYHLALSFAAMAVCASAPTPAQGVFSESTRAAMVAFYHHFDGDRWRRRDGWLDPAVHPCDWYGVRCGGPTGLWALFLPGNGLRGDWSGAGVAITGHVVWFLDLSSNEISGRLESLPDGPEYLRLSFNRLWGPLPEVPADAAPGRLGQLQLAGNQFSGEVPTSWRGLGLHWLDLADNRLQGDPAAAFAAMRDQKGVYLDLAGNGFDRAPDAGELGTAFWEHDENGSAGGLNLCWNPLPPPTPAEAALISQFHLGGADWLGCLGGPRVPLDLGLAGSWAPADGSGSGLLLQFDERGRPQWCWLGFDMAGQQTWLCGSGRSLAFTLRLGSASSLRGDFATGLVSSEAPATPLPAGGLSHARLDRVAEDRLHLQRVYQDFTHCPPQQVGGWPCFARPLSDSFDLQRLSRQAGSGCDLRHPAEALSGFWDDAERPATRVWLQVQADGRVLFAWLSFSADGDQQPLWLVGEGRLAGEWLALPQLLRPRGGQWRPAPGSAVEETLWGEAWLRFEGDDLAVLHWRSVDPKVAGGRTRLQRRQPAALARCSESPLG